MLEIENWTVTRRWWNLRMVLKGGNQSWTGKSLNRVCTIPEINATIDFRFRLDQASQGAEKSPTTTNFCTISGNTAIILV